MSLPARILAALCLLAVAFASGWGAAIRHRNGQDARQALEASESAREAERLAQRNLTRIEDAKTAELRVVGDRLADALERVRDRPARLPEPARAACKGTTGAELADRDGGFLARFAADAARLQAAYDACAAREQANYEAMTKRFN